MFYSLYDRQGTNGKTMPLLGNFEEIMLASDGGRGERRSYCH
ncbi:MAG: hypothetical protein ONB13_08050 [candidate division KSB1 bacterium]|nr:hypothetical protein [candidate division KSB1 bacterium]MDZ7335405.1 hypothetical protein [candidate division KSB1 bacterium]MDZ7356415.1 hypothetical protein [candidate division KSB1 bacterium]MDZ7376559.1 hypothetical protein [candidate division KSB1 bacterium]MDZ7401186.1 hypothetical protein [candidate division KSB1 bacterium]